MTKIDISALRPPSCRRNALVQVGDIGIQHPDAAIRHESADRTRLIGAVDRVFAALQRHRGKRPFGLRGEPPGMTSGIDGLSRLTSLGGDHAGYRYLPSIRVVAGPLLAGPADADGIAHRVILIDNQIEPALIGFHHDRSGE